MSNCIYCGGKLINKTKWKMGDKQRTGYFPNTYDYFTCVECQKCMMSFKKMLVKRKKDRLIQIKLRSSKE